MHWIYSIYLFLAIVQGPVLLAMIATGNTVPCKIISVTPNVTAGTAAASVESRNLAIEAACAAIAAVCFGVIFMINTTLEDANRIMLRFCFWVFVFYHGCVIHYGWPYPFERSEIYLASSLRALALWIICRTAPDEKTAGLFCGAGMYIFWFVMYTTYFSNGGMGAALGVVMATSTMDILLAVGHGYDELTTPMVVSNCRLCFVAISGWTILALSLFSKMEK